MTQHVARLRQQQLILIPVCPHNMVNFGLLAAEIVSGVWGTPVTFNGFLVLAALLCGRQLSSERQPNFAR